MKESGEEAAAVAIIRQYGPVGKECEARQAVQPGANTESKLANWQSTNSLHVLLDRLLMSNHQTELHLTATSNSCTICLKDLCRNIINTGDI
jgi:hypothetical protein